MQKFKVELAGSFYTYELYDSKGREIFELDKAIEAAEWQYAGVWNSVYNGNEAADNPELAD